MEIFNTVHDFYMVVALGSFILFIFPCFSIPFRKWKQLPMAVFVLMTVLFLPELCAFLIYRDGDFPLSMFLVDCLAFLLVLFTGRNVEELHSDTYTDDVDFRFL